MKIQLIDNKNQLMTGAKYWAALAILTSGIGYGAAEFPEYSPVHNVIELLRSEECATGG